MAASFGIIYATGSAQIRRYVYPDNDAALSDPNLLLPGESIVTVSRGPYLNSAAWQAAISNAVTNATGKPPAVLTCAVVDSTNTVVNMISADPAVDTLPGFTLVLVYSPQIVIGCTYDSGTGLFTIPAKSGFDRNNNPVSVPAQVIPKS